MQLKLSRNQKVAVGVGVAALLWWRYGRAATAPKSPNASASLDQFVWLQGRDEPRKCWWFTPGKESVVVSNVFCAGNQ